MTVWPPGWSRRTWGEIAVLRYGRGLTDYRSSAQGVPVYGTNGRVGWTASAALCPHAGVIVGRKGAYRGIHYSAHPFFVIDTAYWLQPLGHMDLHWAYYQLLTQDINGMDSGSAVPSTSRPDFYALSVLVPPIIEQRAIAARLGALDDRIESNRRLLRTVLSLTEAEVQAAIGVAGARTLPVTALARFVNGGAYTKGATGSGRMVLRIAELNSGPGGSTVYTELDVSDDQTARAGDLLMSWSGSLDVYRWTRDEAIINQHIFKVIPKDLPAWLVHDRLKAVMPIFQSIAKDKATTMGHIQRGHLEGTTVPMPSAEQIDFLDDRLRPLWARLLLAEREIHKLAALRDALLPELLSGRIRAPEAREVVNACH